MGFPTAARKAATVVVMDDGKIPELNFNTGSQLLHASTPIVSPPSPINDTNLQQPCSSAASTNGSAPSVRMTQSPKIIAPKTPPSPQSGTATNPGSATSILLQEVNSPNLLMDDYYINQVDDDLSTPYSPGEDYLAAPSPIAPKTPVPNHEQPLSKWLPKTRIEFSFSLIMVLDHVFGVSFSSIMVLDHVFGVSYDLREGMRGKAGTVFYRIGQNGNYAHNLYGVTRPKGGKDTYDPVTFGVNCFKSHRIIDAALPQNASGRRYIGPVFETVEGDGVDTAKISSVASPFSPSYEPIYSPKVEMYDIPGKQIPKARSASERHTIVQAVSSRVREVLGRKFANGIETEGLKAFPYPGFDPARVHPLPKQHGMEPVAPRSIMDRVLWANKKFHLTGLCEVLKMGPTVEFLLDGFWWFWLHEFGNRDMNEMI
eukprot:gene23402-1443_t